MLIINWKVLYIIRTRKTLHLSNLFHHLTNHKNLLSPVTRIFLKIIQYHENLAHLVSNHLCISVNYKNFKGHFKIF